MSTDHPGAAPARDGARWRRGPGARRRLAHLLLRLRVALDHDALDRALASGADPRTDPALVLRADRLERPAHRRALARSLRRIVAQTTRPAATARGAGGRLVRSQVCDDADALLALALRLACPHPAQATGIAIARRLVTDAIASPIYVVCEPRALGRLSRLAVTAMGSLD